MRDLFSKIRPDICQRLKTSRTSEENSGMPSTSYPWTLRELFISIANLSIGLRLQQDYSTNMHFRYRRSHKRLLEMEAIRAGGRVLNRTVFDVLNH
ncbi:MAG: hypothetical protein ACI84C_002963 [Flavobacteriales bacterium]|jgi:hypothetical protein